MTRRPDETTEAYHARLAAEAKPPSLLARVRAALRADFARHDITDYQFMMGLDPLTSPKTVTPDQPQAVPDAEPAHIDILRGEIGAALGFGDEPVTNEQQRNVEAVLCAVQSHYRTLAARPVLPVETPAEGLREALMLAALAEYGMQHALESEREQLGRRSAVRGIMVRLRLYDTFCKLLADDATPDEVRAALAPATPAPLSGSDGSLREAVAKFFEEIDGEPEKDCWDTENGEPEEGVEKFASDWSWSDHHKRVAKAHEDLRAALAAVPPETAEMERYSIDHDGFIGTVIGRYTRLDDGKRGVVMQQDGTKIVHVYGEKWLKPADRLAARASSSGEAGDE